MRLLTRPMLSDSAVIAALMTIYTGQCVCVCAYVERTEAPQLEQSMHTTTVLLKLMKRNLIYFTPLSL